MQFISMCFEEHHKRWNKMGQIIGFHESLPVPPRQFSDTASEVSIPFRTHHSLPSSIGASPYKRTRGLTSSSIDGRNSIQYDSVVHSQVPSLKDQVMDCRTQTFSDRDPAFSSNSISVQLCGSSSVGSRSSIASHSSDEAKSPYHTNGSITTKNTASKRRSKHIEKKDSSSDSLEEGLAHSSLVTSAIVRNRAKQVYDSDV